MISASNLYKFFNKGKSNEIKAINGISLDLDTGLVMIVGKSGCGKSTLLHTLAGLAKPDSGAIKVGDVTLDRYNSDTWDKIRNRKIGYVFQNYNLLNDLTVYQNLEIALKLAGVDPAEYDDRIHYALSLVGMDKYAKRLPNTLSGGQQQRVGVARAIVKGPEILIADEPTGNLDDTNTIAVMEILKGLSKHCLVVVVTHEEDLAAFYADRIIRVVDGKIVEDYDNQEGTGSLAHRAQDKIYLGDMQSTDLSDNVRLFVPKDGDVTGKIDIVYQNGRVLLRVQGVANVSLLNEDSTIQLIEGKYVPRDKKQEDLAIDSSKLTAGQGKTRNPFGLVSNLKQSLKPMLEVSGKKRLNPYHTLYAAAVLFVIVLALVAPSFVYNRAESICYDDHLLGVVTENVPADSSYAVLKGTYEGEVALDWSGLSIDKSVTMGGYSLTVLPASCVGATVADGQVLVDKLMYQRMKDAGQLDGIASTPDEIKHLVLSFGTTKLTIAGTVERNQPTLYVSDNDYAALQFIRPGVEYKKVTYQPVVIYASDVKAVKKALDKQGYTVIELAKNDRSNYYSKALTGRILFLILGVLSIVIQVFALRRIAKSQYISQIRTYVQYRAIGVPKKFLYSKVVSQSSMVCILTTLRGWLITSVCMGIIASLDVWKTVAFFLGAKLLYYPWWLALIAGIFLYATNMVCNLISPVTLLRRTPADLMTKYDI